MTATDALAIARDIIPHSKTSQINNKTLEQKVVNFPRPKKDLVCNLKRAYRILFINVSKVQKSQFQNSKCLFLVSVGQPYHEGLKLEAALKCMNKNFKEIVIIVGDTIQRYTYAVHQHKTAQELLAFAENEGSKWLERNGSIIEKTLTKPHKIFRWDHFRKHSLFNSTYAIIDNASKSDDVEYKLAFEECSKEFLQRASRNSLNLAPESTELCMQYLKEECTCMCLWTEENCEFLTYPYGINSVFRATYKRYIEQPYHGIMREIGYDIKGKDVYETGCT